VRLGACDSFNNVNDYAIMHKEVTTKVRIKSAAYRKKPYQLSVESSFEFTAKLRGFQAFVMTSAFQDCETMNGGSGSFGILAVSVGTRSFATR
jgi:hypothetical protein